MLLTIWLIIGAVTFGALLEQFGLIDRLVRPLITAAKTTGRLYLSVFASAIGLNIVAGDQYIALVLPSRIFRVEFEQRGLAPQNLSRLAADSGTVTSPLVPWNSCGASWARYSELQRGRTYPSRCSTSPVRCSVWFTVTPGSKSSSCLPPRKQGDDR
jgi:Na+/H+ antiporter NhaC